MSSWKMVDSASTSGTSPMTMRRAKPSAMAVLPTPGSPTNSGLFFCRRHSTWMVRWISEPAADQGIDPAGARLLVQVDAIDLERIGAALLLVAAFDGRGILFHAAHGARLGHAGALGDAVADVVHRIEAGHVLLLQEEGGVALALGEDRHQHIGAGHLLAAGGLHMGDGAVDNALEAGGRLGVVVRIEHEARELVVEISGELVPQQVDIDVAGAHYRRGVAIVEQRQEQMLERRIFVAALIGVLQSAPEGLFQTGRKGSHLDPHSFSMVHCSGCSC